MKKMTRYATSVIFVLAVAATVLLVGKSNNNDVKYKLGRVERGQIASKVLASGTVNPVLLVSVGSQVSGTIQKTYVDFNSPVTGGQVIAQIDPAVFRAEVEQAHARYESALAGKKQKEVQVLDTKRTFDRNQELLNRDLIAQSDLDAASTTYQSTLAELQAAKSAVLQAQAALDLAESNLRYTTIHSPVTGTVVSRNVDVGQTVAASFQAPVLFTIAQDLSKMQVNTSVDEADIGMVATGQKADFTVDAYPGKTFAGTVAQVRNAPQTIQNVVTYDVIVSVNNPGLKLKPGMTANVAILVDRKNGVLKIPSAAVRFQPPEKELMKHKGLPKGPLVWKVLPENQLQPVQVRPGITDDKYAELISGDLKEGDSLAVEIMEGKKKDKDKAPGFRPF
ncbi:MAG: efflux RND transporter periplasmic adaptor subunit [Pseudomonadota bacterium]